MTKRKKNKKESNVDVEALKRWKRASTKAKLNWLDSAFRFGKLRQF